MKSDYFKGRHLEDSKFLKIRQTHFWVPLFLSFLIVGITISTVLFIPDFIFKNPHTTKRFGYFSGTFWEYLTSKHIFKSGDSGIITAASFYLIFFFFSQLFALLTTFNLIRRFLSFLTTRKWFKKYCGYATEIIENSNIDNRNWRIALSISVCNDLTPTTILQTVNQTYKNVDVWLLDDSTKPDQIKAVDNFAKAHGFRVCRRSIENKKAHPSTIGNVMHFVQKYRDQYDFLFETGTSTIATNTFLENSLRFFAHAEANGKKIGAVSANGSFYSSNNLFSYVISKKMQYRDGIDNAMGFRTTGTQFYVNGWASVYDMKTIASIPLEMVECPKCDVARSYWMTMHNIRTMFNPFDFSGKLATQNIYRYKNQYMKWIGGDVFIFKKYISKNFHGWRDNLFVFTHNIGFVFYVISFIFGLCNKMMMIFCNYLSFTNWTGKLIQISCMAGLIIIFALAILITKSDLWLLLMNYCCEGFKFSLKFRQFFQTFVYAMLFGKWSSRAVTVKKTEKVSSKQWIKMSRLDIIIILIATSVALILTFYSNLSINTIWSNLYMYVCGPSILFLCLWLVSLIPIKFGWSEKNQNFDIAKHDFRYKYIKGTKIWKQQHPEGK